MYLTLKIAIGLLAPTLLALAIDRLLRRAPEERSTVPSPTADR